nr:hypothetical protein GCM10020092_018120 [Actinoplanes digitatis]
MSVEKYGMPAAGAEDDDAALLEVPDGAQRDVRLRDLGHRDRGLHPRLDALLLEEVLQGEAVHDRAEHAHVVGPVAVHAALLQLGAAEEVAATDDNGDLHAAPGGRGDLPGEALHHVGVDAHRTAAEDLTGELQHDPPGPLGTWRRNLIDHDSLLGHHRHAGPPFPSLTRDLM